MNGDNDSPVRRNSGIMINRGNLSADVLAVGDNARATKIGGTGVDHEQLRILLDTLRTALANSVDDPRSRDILTTDLQAIEEEAARPEPDVDRFEQIIRSFSDKLKLIGGVASNSGALIAATKKLAQALGVTTALF